MRISILFTFLFLSCLANAQTFKFYNSNTIKFKRGNDTLRFPFIGGVDAPQFANFDFNNDGKLDLFIFDKSTNKVLCFLYTNTGWQHAPQYELAFPFMTDFALGGDYNADGKTDLFTTVVDDLKYTLDSTTRVFGPGLRLFKNTSTGANFSLKQINPQVKDTGRSGMGFSNPSPFGLPPRNISTSRVDNMAIGDMDNDGDDDILKFDGLQLSPEYIENYKINKFNIQYPADSTRFIYRDQCWGDMQYAASSGKNQFNLHLRRDQLANCEYRLYGKTQKHAGTGMVMLDYTNDGIKDIVYGDVSYKNLILLKNGRGQNSQGRDSIADQDTLFPRNTVPFNFIDFPSPYYVDIDGDNKKDLLVSTNYTVGVANTNNVWTYNNTGTTANPVFNYGGNNFFLFNQGIDLGSRTVPIIIDIDNDGKKDLLVATSGNYEQTLNVKDKLVYYRNIGRDTTPVYQLQDSNFLNLTKDTAILEMHPTFGDLNGDGKNDLIIGNSNGKLEYYINQTTGTNYSFALVTRNLSDIDVGNNSAPQLFDLNKDGKLDLLVGAKNGTVSYFKNNGTITVPNFSQVPTIDTLGNIITNYKYTASDGYDRMDEAGYATPHACELDGDTNTIEMLVGSAIGEVYLYTNISDTLGKVFPRQEKLFALNAQAEAKSLRFGLRSVPFTQNLDGDKRPDMMIGNLGGGLNFYASNSTYNPGNGILEMEQKPSSILLYPNPAQTTIQLNTDQLRENVDYKIVNMMGQVIKTGSVNYFYATHTIDIGDMEAGMYFVSFKGEETSYYARFLIQR